MNSNEASSETDVNFFEALFVGKKYADDVTTQSADGSARFWGPATGIQWCERDYEVTPYIAEFFNTLTNIGFLLVGIRCIVMQRKYNLPKRYLGLAATLICLALTSAFFHATLWLSAQRADEIFENMVLAVLFHSQEHSQAIAVAHSALLTFGVIFVTAFLFAELHLIFMVLGLVGRVGREVVDVESQTEKSKHNHDPNIRYTTVRAGATTGFAFIFWLLDRLACGHIRQLPVNPQLHAWWHLACAFALHEALILASFLYFYRNAGQPTSSTLKIVQSKWPPFLSSLDSSHLKAGKLQ